jgi:hypothetical protein
MKLSAPKQVTWIIAVVVGAVGILSTFIAIPVLSGIAFWLLVAGFGILALSTALGGF